MDNGSELTCAAFMEWAERQQIKLWFIQPGQPDQNAFIERFNRSYREEVLDAYLLTRSSKSVRSAKAGCGNTTRNGHTKAWAVCRL